MRPKNGIPSQEEYYNLIHTPLFQVMESFSDDFLIKFDFLKYKYKWVKDPFHQWSRQWEYPYVFTSIKNYLRAHKVSAPKILDAGSGITFFPYYLSNEIEDATIACCDYDRELLPFFNLINKGRSHTRQVEFHYADLHILPFEDSLFDVVYTISVLEHTKDYASIISEFARVLKPGGTLIITFDIALDGVSDVAYHDAEWILAALSREFNLTTVRRPIKEQIIERGLFTTDYAKKLNEKLLPWQYPLLSLIKSSAISRRIPRRLSKCLTVYCETICKNEIRSSAYEDR
jgi:SAM-dependent methyltransferase